jgi:hypothetical protein
MLAIKAFHELHSHISYMVKIKKKPQLYEKYSKYNPVFYYFKQK